MKKMQMQILKGYVIYIYIYMYIEGKKLSKIESLLVTKKGILLSKSMFFFPSLVYIEFFWFYFK